MSMERMTPTDHHRRRRRRAREWRNDEGEPMLGTSSLSLAESLQPYYGLDDLDDAGTADITDDTSDSSSSGSGGDNDSARRPVDPEAGLASGQSRRVTFAAEHCEKQIPDGDDEDGNNNKKKRGKAALLLLSSAASVGAAAASFAFKIVRKLRGDVDDEDGEGLADHAQELHDVGAGPTGAEQGAAAPGPTGAEQGFAAPGPPTGIEQVAQASQAAQAAQAQAVFQAMVSQSVSGVASAAGAAGAAAGGAAAAAGTATAGGAGGGAGAGAAQTVVQAVAGGAGPAQAVVGVSVVAATATTAVVAPQMNAQRSAVAAASNATSLNATSFPSPYPTPGIVETERPSSSMMPTTLEAWPDVPPTFLPTASPSPRPTSSPSSRPSPSPTTRPSLRPTTSRPTATPTARPTRTPTTRPTRTPTNRPTTVAPSLRPTVRPTVTPGNPTALPTFAPTDPPTVIPTPVPTNAPTYRPTSTPTSRPTTSSPTFNPTTNAPTPAPNLANTFVGHDIFSHDRASVGQGSLYGEVDANDVDGLSKIRVEYFEDDLWNKPADYVEWISYDVYIESCGAGGPPCEHLFYLNLLTRSPGWETRGIPYFYYDCGIDYIAPDMGIEGEWQTFKFNLLGSTSRANSKFASTANAVTASPPRSKVPFFHLLNATGCLTHTDEWSEGTDSPTALASKGYTLGSNTGAVFAINMGDESTDDNGLKGNIDNVQVKVRGEDEPRVYDFEPM